MTEQTWGDNGQFIQVSIHEAGHLVIGEVLRRTGALYLFRQTPTAPWHGRVRFGVSPDLWRADERIVVALAGVVAEATVFADNSAHRTTLLNDIEGQGGGLCMPLSVSDFELAAGCGQTHIDEVFRLVSENVAQIESKALAARELAHAAPGGLGIWPPP
jgi:hypothetical protein